MPGTASSKDVSTTFPTRLSGQNSELKAWRFSKTAPAGKEESTTVENYSAMQEQVPLDKETEELIYTGNFQPSKDTMETVNSIYEEKDT